MTSWNDVAAAAPDLAQQARAIFDRHLHKTMATVRRDGSPRISGTELELKDGELWLGSMPQARKAQDLRRDPRVAVHSASADPKDLETGAAGDAKIAGRALEVTDPEVLADFAAKAPPGPFHLFCIDVTELVVTRIEPPDTMVVDFWTPAGGRRTVRRH